MKKNFFFFINNKNLDFSYIFVDDLILSIELLINKKKYVTSIYNISNNIKETNEYTTDAIQGDFNEYLKNKFTT